VLGGPPLPAAAVAAALGALALAIGLGTLGPRVRSVPARAGAATACAVAAAMALATAPTLVDAEKPLWAPVAAARAPGEALGAALRANDSWGFLPWAAREPVAYFGYPSRLVVVPPESVSPETYRPRADLDAWLDSPQRRWLMLRVRDHDKLRSPVWVVSRGTKYEIVTNRPYPTPGP
jgi:hypothetical protein